MNVTLTISSTNYEDLIYNVIHPILGIIVVTFNTLVVFSSGLLLKSGPASQKKSTVLFLGNLALTEIVNVVITQFKLWYKVNENSSIYSCIILVGLKVVPYITNLYSVGLIALDRYLYISYGMQYEKWVYPKRSRTLILTTWIFGFAMGSIPLVWNKPKRRNDSKICFASQITPKEYILFMLIVSLVPVILVTISYSKILCKAIHKINDLDDAKNSQESNFRKHRGSVKSENHPESGSVWTVFRLSASPTTKKKLNAVKIVALTTGCFVLTWLPFTVTYLLYLYLCESEQDRAEKKCVVLVKVLRVPFLLLGAVHGIVNPIIYAWWHKGFREYWMRRFRNFLKPPL